MIHLSTTCESVEKWIAKVKWCKILAASYKSSLQILKAFDFFFDITQFDWLVNTSLDFPLKTSIVLCLSQSPVINHSGYGKIREAGNPMLL